MCLWTMRQTETNVIVKDCGGVKCIIVVSERSRGGKLCFVHDRS